MTQRDTVVTSAVVRLRDLIETEYGQGDRLPNEKQLADDLVVSRGTVREALGVLATEGRITRRWGVGTFVGGPGTRASLDMGAIESYRDRVQHGGHTAVLRESSCELVLPPSGARLALGLPARVRTWRVYRLFCVDGVPSAALTEHVPTTLHGVPIDPSAMSDIATDLFEMLDAHVSGIVWRTVTDVAARALDHEEARAFEVEDGHPVLQAEQVTFDRHDTPLAHSASLQRTDLVRLRIPRQLS
jgi:GntR family transcriptional regulator